MSIISAAAVFHYKAFFCLGGKDPFDLVEWSIRDITLKDSTGKIIFSQNVEAPVTWSDRAVCIVAQKYFYGKLGTPQREHSVKQLITRVVDTIYHWSIDQSYCDTDAAEALRNDLAYLLVTQHGAFNSPVFFNLGIEERKPQVSACFINSVEDNMESIAELQTTETSIFKGGSGSGVNLSKIRGSIEHLSNGGIASGPVSFMKGYDAWAGAIKSGGTTRRAAAIRILNDDHPDILEFIECKAKEEHVARLLVQAGISADFDDPNGAYVKIGFQNANHSVRLSDAFMKKVVHALENPNEEILWDLKAVKTGEVIKQVPILTLWKAICASTWSCGDPALQFDDTINNWHTCPEDGKQVASNPCFVGYTLIETAIGRIKIADLAQWKANRRILPYALTYDPETQTPTARYINRVWKTGDTSTLVCVRTKKGASFTCTPNHPFYLHDGTTIPAQDLKPGQRLRAWRFDYNHPKEMEDYVKKIETVRLDAPVPIYNMEVHDLHTYSVTCESIDYGFIVSNCGEFSFLNDSACNLASLNLMKFRQTDGQFDIDAFKHAVRAFIIAQEILIDKASYPTQKITENSKRYRPLGLGYSNLGALLMSKGIPYDSNEGRNFAAYITSTMTSMAYSTSARMAAYKGPFCAYENNKEAMLDIIRRQHDVAAAFLTADAVADWNNTFTLGKNYGFRNAQVTLLAPTGTISFMMDCDTTGIEPELSLYKTKQLVGGGTVVMENRIVDMALEALGYEIHRRNLIKEYLCKYKHLENCPDLLEKHLKVFDCAIAAPGQRSLSSDAHLLMCAAVQPFLSGAISKTINIPNNATPEDISDTYIKAWQKGLKSVTIYRDNCKQSQPLNTTPVKRNVEVKTSRRKLNNHQSNMHRIRFAFGNIKGYVLVTPYEDTGMPGEIFVKLSKEGSTISGLVDGWARSISYNLQYGVPLETLVKKFSHTKFEPSGYSPDPDIKYAHSIYDAIMRKLEAVFINKKNTPKGTTKKTKNEQLTNIEGPPCNVCGALMQRSGACYSCPVCGETSGCG